jgi:DNA primase
LKKEGWVRNYPEGVHKGDTLFGIERAHGSTGLLLESPLDVVRFHSVYGGSDVSAVASFGANVSSNQLSLLCDRFDALVIALDNDKAGKMETKRVARSLPSLRRGVRYWRYVDDVKDLGDMSDVQIIKGISNTSVIHV